MATSSSGSGDRQKTPAPVPERRTVSGLALWAAGTVLGVVVAVSANWPL